MSDTRRQQLIQFMASEELNNPELSKRMSLEYSHIFRIVSGERPVSDSFIGRFAQVFGFDVAERVFGEPAEDKAA